MRNIILKKTKVRARNHREIAAMAKQNHKSFSGTGTMVERLRMG